MYVNALNDEHSNDENTVHTEDKVQHVDKADRQHSQKVQMRRSMMMAALLGYLHPFPDFAFSILYDDFGTKFLPGCCKIMEKHKNGPMNAKFRQFGDK